MAALVFLIYTAVTGIASSVVVGNILVMGALGVGYASVILKLARGRGEVDLADMAKGFVDGYIENLLLGLVAMLKVFLWSLLFVIPGIVKVYSYSMIYCIKNDHPSYAWQACLSESERLMRSKRINLFSLDLSFIGRLLLAPFTFGLSAFWGMPRPEQARAILRIHSMTGNPRLFVGGDFFVL